MTRCIDFTKFFTFRPLDISRIRALLLEPHDHTLFGTTFPPSRCLLQKVQAHKYHSETDLVKAQDDNDSGTCPQAQLEQPTKEKSHENTEELTDSDLFFDFDIESPQEAIDQGDDEKVIVNAENSLDCQEVRRSSESSLESVTMTGKPIFPLMGTHLNAIVIAHYVFPSFLRSVNSLWKHIIRPLLRRRRF